MRQRLSQSVVLGTLLLGACFLLDARALAAEPSASLRQTISLNGRWEIADGPMEPMPAVFDRHVPVPGLADLAKPPFAEVGTQQSGRHRRAFWYRRSFSLKGPMPRSVRLRIHKAVFR